jgi:hypothetical protein
MAIAVLVARWLTPPMWPLSWRFALEATAGALTYPAIMLSLHRSRIEAFRSMIREMRSS